MFDNMCTCNTQNQLIQKKKTLLIKKKKIIIKYDIFVCMKFQAILQIQCTCNFFLFKNNILFINFRAILHKKI